MVMEERINVEQLENLVDVLNTYNVPKKVILKIFNVNSLFQLTVKQYNFLLLLLKN